jgi:hypothetical protein
MRLIKGILNPSRVPHDVKHLSCACTALTISCLLVYGLVFAKVRSHLIKLREIHSTRKRTLGWLQPGAHAQWQWSLCLDIGEVVGAQGKATVQ